MARIASGEGRGSERGAGISKNTNPQLTQRDTSTDAGAPQRGQLGVVTLTSRRGSRAARRSSSSGASSAMKWPDASGPPSTVSAQRRQTASGPSDIEPSSAPQCTSTGQPIRRPASRSSRVGDPVDVEAGAVVGADGRDRVGRERAQVAVGRLRRDRPRRGRPRVEHVAQEVLGARGDQPLGERRRLGEEEPGPVVERGLRGHALELVDGRHDVEHAEPVDDPGVVERHPVADPAAAVVADDREALEARAAPSARRARPPSRACRSPRPAGRPAPNGSRRSPSGRRRRRCCSRVRAGATRCQQ